MSDPYEFPDLAGASCAEVGFDHFFPPFQQSMKSPELRPIKELCDSCPVIQKCLMYALHVEVHGIWGGTINRERKELRKQLGIQSRSVQAQFEIDGILQSLNTQAMSQRALRRRRKLEKEQEL
jgi:WhiB family redox-sensing transcriptional regulator